MFFSGNCLAGTLFEVGATYLSESIATPTSQTSSKYFYNAAILFSLNKTTWGGWNFSGMSHSETATTTTDFASQDTGPYLKWQFGRNELFSLSAAYNITSKATYSNGSSTENWEGTSIWVQWGVTPELKEGLHIGASLNYYSANYTKKIVSSVESSASNSKTWIFPMLTLTKNW